jgi:hypothetical protein
MRDQISVISEQISDKPDPSKSLAERLRAGSKALDHDEIAPRVWRRSGRA